MRIHTIIVAAVLALASTAARAEAVILQDPDKWIEGALKDIADGKTDDFARNYLKLIDKPDSFDALSGNMRPLSRMGRPVFLEKVHEIKYGTALRQVIYLALFRQTDYTYFRFTLKKNHDGWLISNFDMKIEPAELFPRNFTAGP